MKPTSSLLFLIGYFYCALLFSQDFIVEGVVVDATGSPVELATVTAYEAGSDAFITGGATAADGHFKLQFAQKGSYYLHISYLEQVLERFPFSLDGHINLGELVVSLDTSLEEVAVVANQPRLERQVDRYVFTIANSTLTEGSMAEALARTPGLLVINNQINYKGDTGVGVMINNKLINLPKANVWAILENAPAGAVKAIEIITNPPAKYSAEGGVLINIKMEGNLVAGYNGSVNAKYAQGDFPKYNLGTDHFFKNKKAALTLTYGYADAKKTKGFMDSTNFMADGAITNWAADQNRVTNTLSHNGNVFFDYKLSEQTKLAVTTINQFTPKNDQEIHTKTNISGGEPAFNAFVSQNQVGRKALSSSTYVDLAHQFKEGGNLALGFHFTYFENDREQQLTNDFFNGADTLVDEIDFATLSDQQIRITSAQLDYDAAINQLANYAIGAKFVGIDSNSFLQQLGTEDMVMLGAPTMGSFYYDEQVYAAYGEVDMRWEKTKLSMGLRAEYTDAKGVLDGADDRFANDYLQWFPKLSFNHKLDKGRSIILYYYRRITRPRYNQINPFVLFQGYNSTVEGNPRLQPATRHYLAGGYNFNKWLGVELFYRHRSNQLRTLTFQENDQNLIRFIHANVKRELGYGLDIIFNKQLSGFWNTYALVSCFYLDNEFVDLESGRLGTTSGWTFQFTNNNTFALLPNRSLSLDVDFVYRAPQTYGNAKDGAYGSVNLFLRKRLWQGQGSITAGVTDIFSQTAYLETRRFLNQDNSSFVDPETPIASIAFRYRFGNTTIKSNKKRKRRGEVERL